MSSLIWRNKSKWLPRQDLRDPILAKNEEFKEYNRQLRASFETFRSLMVQVEEFGDGAVEELENNPDTPIT